MQADLLEQNKPNPNQHQVTGELLAKYLGVSERQVRRLAQPNENHTRPAVLVKVEDNRYLFHQSVKGYIAYLKEYQGIDDENAVNPKKAKALFEYYKAEEQKLKVLTLKKEMIEISGVVEFIAQLFTEVRQGMRQVGGKIRDQLAETHDRIEIKNIIDRAINQQLYDISESAEELSIKLLGDEQEIAQ